jgi:hypothetical protein
VSSDRKQIVTARTNPLVPEQIRAELEELRSVPLGAVKCSECLRVFDLALESDSAEWSFGHDCEE